MRGSDLAGLIAASAFTALVPALIVWQEASAAWAVVVWAACFIGFCTYAGTRGRP